MAFLSYYQLKKWASQPSDSPTETVIKEGVLKVVDLKAGVGSGRVTCLGGGLDDIHFIQAMLNPLTRKLDRFGVKESEVHRIEKKLLSICKQ